MKRCLSLFLCLILLLGVLPMAAPARAADSAPAGLTVTSVTASKTSVGVGETITWTAAASGGSGTIKYCFYVYKDGATIQKGSYSTARTYSYTASAAGTYSVKAFVKDGSGTSASMTGGYVNCSSAGDYALLVATYTLPDDYGTQAYYAQVILGNGNTAARLPISKETYDRTDLFVNNVYKLTSTGSYWTFSPAGSAEVSREAYNLNDPFTDYTDASFIWYNGGSLSNLQTQLNRYLPQANSEVIIAYTYERSGTVNLRRVRSVWFTNAASNTPVPVSNSFIYLASMDPKSQYILNGKVVSTYDGYMNGSPMADLVTATAPNRIGFATYSKRADGVYALSFLADGNGTATGVRTFALENSGLNAQNNVLQPASLSLRDGNGAWQSMSMSGVTVTKVGAAAATMVQINSVQDLINAVSQGWKITVSLVEVVSGSTHSVGGSVIYVTDISADTPVSPLAVDTVTASKTSAASGETITWTAAASGGSGTIRYCFYVYKDGVTVWKGSYGVGNSCSYTPTSAGTYSVKAFVKDGAGSSASKTGGNITVS